MLLETEAITKQFGHITAVDSVSFGVERGQLLSIIGPNGAGKTTLFNLVSGALEPTSGTIQFDGDDVTGLSPEHRSERGMGRSFQITNIFSGLTTKENIQIATQRQEGASWTFYRSKDSFDAINDRCADILSRVGLDQHTTQRADTLSHGDKRRLELGIALATEPKLLLLDEPTAGMAPEETENMIDLIRTLSEDHTVLLIEHDMDVVAEVSDEIMVLHQGQKLVQGSVSDVLNDEDVQAAYLGGL
jgi:branched-chain amino acid transport system ATP-binding protein